MPPIPWRPIADWFQQHQILLGWLAGFSLITFLGSLIVVPLVIVKLPKDFMVRNQRAVRSWPALLYVPLLVIKNLAGIVFILVGLALLFLPGQGVLTIAIGLLLIDLPGKRNMVRRLIGQPQVFLAINKLRSRFGKDPFQLPE
jgi:hypothetical protein